jgi:hypothetical protein
MSGLIDDSANDNDLRGLYDRMILPLLLWAAKRIICFSPERTLRFVRNLRNNLRPRAAIAFASGWIATLVCLGMLAAFFAPRMITFRAFKPSTKTPNSNVIPAIAIVAMGSYDPRPLVSSLRNKGRYSGRIFVLGDGCTPEPPADEATFIDVHSSSSLPPTEASFSSQPTSARIKAKLMKQNLFNIIPKSLDTERILYLDSDIEVNKDLYSFMRDAASWKPKCNVYLFRERNYVKSLWSGGAMFLDRHYSARFLDAWAHELQRHSEFHRDQLALALALAADPSSRSKGASDSDGTSQEDSDTHFTTRGEDVEEQQAFQVCALPSAHMSYGADFVTYLRKLSGYVLANCSWSTFLLIIQVIRNSLTINIDIDNCSSRWCSSNNLHALDGT